MIAKRFATLFAEIPPNSCIQDKLTCEHVDMQLDTEEPQGDKEEKTECIVPLVLYVKASFNGACR